MDSDGDNYQSKERAQRKRPPLLLYKYTKPDFSTKLLSTIIECGNKNPQGTFNQYKK